MLVLALWASQAQGLARRRVFEMLDTESDFVELKDHGAATARCFAGACYTAGTRSRLANGRLQQQLDLKNQQQTTIEQQASGLAQLNMQMAQLSQQQATSSRTP